MTKLEMEENDRWAKKWAGVATVIILFLIITSAVWKTIYPDKAPTIILVSGIVEQSHIGFEGKGRTSYPSVRIIGDASVYVFDPIHVEVGMPGKIWRLHFPHIQRLQ